MPDIESSQVRLSKPIQSIAISDSGDRAVALVNHNHVYCLDLSADAELSNADCWVVPRPTQDGNRRVRIQDSAIVFAGEDQVYLCHSTNWQTDPKDQLNIQQLDLRTGEVLREWDVPCRISFRCSAIPLSDDLLLIGCDEDAVLVQLSQSRSVGTLRETLWDSGIWEEDDEAPRDENVMPKQGLVLDARTGALHALFDGYDKAFVESYRWNNRGGCFRCVKRRTIREADVGGLCVGPTGALAVWMTNRGEEIPIPRGGVEAIKDAQLTDFFAPDPLDDIKSC